MEAHSELLRSAHSIEERRVKEQETSEEFKTRIMSARRETGHEGGVEGMLIDKPGEQTGDDEVELDAEGEPIVKKMPGRKTKQQRRKAEKQRAEVCQIVHCILFGRTNDLLLSVETSSRRTRPSPETSCLSRFSKNFPQRGG